MLKQKIESGAGYKYVQPPSGGCVLKQPVLDDVRFFLVQPPSGGCVLKHGITVKGYKPNKPAAFRRLCVETIYWQLLSMTRPSSRLQAAVC